jgi:predicted anti-sigma-YlaC factor YlaD
MNCSEAKRRWHRAWDDRAGDAELERHLAACPACRHYAEGMRRLMGMLGELRVESDAATSAPRQRTGARDAPTRPSPFRRVPILWRLTRVAAAVTLLIGASLYLRPKSDPESSGPVTRRDELDLGDVALNQSERPSIGVTLRGKSANRYLVTAVPESNPNVAVYRLFPSIARSGANGS